MFDIRHVCNRWASVGALVLAIALASALSPATAHAQYAQLQVLLPGETAAPGTGSGKLGAPDAQTAGIPFDIVVRACDAGWNTVSTVTNQVTLTSTDIGASLPGAASLVSGQVTLSITLNSGGSFTISADDLSDGTIPVSVSAPVPVHVLQGFEFARINQKNQYAGTPMTITVTAVDPGGNRVTGYDGDVVLEELTSFGPGRISPITVTLVNGEWTGPVTNYRADETSINRGNVNIRASHPQDPSVNGISDPFTVHPGPFTRVQVVVPGQSPWPGSANGVSGSPASQGAGQSFQIAVYATDDWWNPLPSVDVVRVTSSDPGASTPVSGALTNGFAQFIVSLGTVGSQTLTVNDQTNGSIQGMTSASIQVTPSGAHHFEIDPIAGPITAGDVVNVTIRAADAGGNTIPDFAGNAILSANTGLGSISPESIVFANGVWSGLMVFRGSGGAVRLNCSDFASPPHIGTSNPFEVVPGPFVRLQVLLAGETPQGGTAAGHIGTPNDQNAGSSFDIRVRAVDAWWNKVDGVTDRIGLGSSDPFAAMPSEIALVNGEAIVSTTLYLAGLQRVSAVDLDAGGIVGHTSSDVTVLSGPYTNIVVVAPGEHIAPGSAEGRAGTATDQSINFAFTLTVYATDSWWNPVSGITDVVRITSGDPLAQLPPDTPLTDGRADVSIRLSTGGFQQITAQNLTTTMPTSTTQVRAISSGFHLEASASPEAVQAGEPFTLTVSIVNDAGSVIQEINSFVDIEVRNASTQDPGRGTLLNTRFQLLQGTRSMQETYTFAEPIVLVVRDDAGNAPGVTSPITVSPGSPSAVELWSNPTWIGGDKNATVTARVVDDWGNGVPSRPVEFALLAGAGTLTALDGTTDAAGEARAEYHSPRRPEVATVRATSGTLQSDLELETALVDPNQAPGSITNYPNPFHPKDAPTTIAYKLAADASVSLRIYSVMGYEVLSKQFQAGADGGRQGLNEFLWDGRNGSGTVVATGGYLAVVEAQGEGETLHVMRRRIGLVR